MKRNIKTHTELLINEIKASKLSADEKIELEDILISAK